jgi:hypothetical protein
MLMSRQSIEFLAAEAGIVEAKTSVSAYGSMLVRTDINMAEVGFLSRAFQAARVTLRQRIEARS